MRACCWQGKRNDAAGEWFILRLKVVRGAEVDLRPVHHGGNGDVMGRGDLGRTGSENAHGAWFDGFGANGAGGEGHRAPEFVVDQDGHTDEDDDPREG